MANTITRQLLINGSRNYVVKFNVIGDGSGEETNTLVNVTTGDMGVSNKIMRVQSDLSGFSARLLFDASTKVFAVDIGAENNIDQRFHAMGGIINNAGTGKTGDILITTTGLGSGDAGHILLTVKKKD